MGGGDGHPLKPPKMGQRKPKLGGGDGNHSKRSQGLLWPFAIPPRVSPPVDLLFLPPGVLEKMQRSESLLTPPPSCQTPPGTVAKDTLIFPAQGFRCDVKVGAGDWTYGLHPKPSTGTVGELGIRTRVSSPPSPLEQVAGW